jgi:hypothetical protein
LHQLQPSVFLIRLSIATLDHYISTSHHICTKCVKLHTRIPALRLSLSCLRVIKTITPQQRRDDMLSKITLALALALAVFSTIVPASAAPGDELYAPGYQDNAYNRNGW